MKKMLSAILSLAMVFTMCTTAFAAEERKRKNSRRLVRVKWLCQTIRV